jgi:hypothetical protein
VTGIYRIMWSLTNILLKTSYLFDEEISSGFFYIMIILIIHQKMH